jgi:GNAT superfamily N-acetyltransferase
MREDVDAGVVSQGPRAGGPAVHRPPVDSAEPFALDDAEAVLRLAARAYTRDSRWHVGDLAWQLGVSGGRSLGERAAVWRTGAEAAGVAWWYVSSEVADPHVSLSVLLEPGSDLLADAIAWAGATTQRRVDVTVAESEHDLVDELRALGYRPTDDAAYFVNLQRLLVDLPAVGTPVGYTIRAVTPVDVEARAALHRAVWGSDSLTTAAYASMTRRWPYDARFDRVAQAPDGRLVAYVHGWLAPDAATGELEPVGTLEPYRRQGLSRAVALSVLHAFRDAGASSALVYARGDDGYPVPRQVYASLGFRPHTRIRRYTLGS